ncbi:uncharacterized protein LOC114265845 isoform X2 [Camellia sinensis]|uniref:uncharacterized protein LOC114265845 isoform X2 n=1 Tax=Camellia sinensis TaxID=4442 RepID=UPI0010367D1A|nr:uncharacterized protein LOC114265845 isoform X2 [Camellia sinensis]
MEAQILLGSKITSLHETSLQYIPNQLGQNVKGFKQSPRHRELRCKSRKPKSSTKRKLLMKYMKPFNLFHDLMKTKPLERRRLLGLEVHDKYVGLAVSDTNNKIVSPLRYETLLNTISFNIFMLSPGHFMGSFMYFFSKTYVTSTHYCYKIC